MMSAEQHVLVPRSCLSTFYSKYKHLVETFYCVELTEDKSFTKDKFEFVYFKVGFDFNSEEQFNPKDVITKIQKYVESSLGWAGERGEDSSYDSEYEDESGHRAASRTPSDTLAAEFAEYVTLTPAPVPPVNQAKLDFALKLGYSEHLVRAALHTLGPDPPTNDFVAELIKLAAMCPSPSSSLPPDPELAPARPLLRHIVIDGSNVAMSHGNKEVFSCRGIEICVNWFRARGHKDITVFVPKWRKEASRPDNPVVDRDALERLERQRVLAYTPSRLVGGKRLVCYDDRYVLRLATDTDGVVVSNDNYRDLVAESPDFRKTVEERLLMYAFVNDRFMPPDDPLGRLGPSLDDFLLAAPAAPFAPFAPFAPPPPCPYGRKCTYGHKCKYHHPERPRRRRPLHTLSLPPPPPPPQPPPAAAKRAVARAHSAAPRLPDPALASHFERAQLRAPSGPDEARRRMYFHLANIFPEARVADAMAAHPAETDAQAMCAILLAARDPLRRC